VSICSQKIETRYNAYSVRVLIAVAPLEDNEEDQPSKQSHQEQHLRNKLNKDVDETLEVAKEYKVHVHVLVIPL
jgi:hypothetical protein